MGRKVIMVGESAVGKTSLVTKYLKQPFSQKTVSTSSPVFVTATENVNGREVALEIWDTAGQEQYRSLMAMYYRGADVALLCFTKETLNTITEWSKVVRDAEPHCEIILALTKLDLLTDDEIQEVRSSVETLEDTVHFTSFIETSSKNNEGVAELFATAAKSTPKSQPPPPEVELTPAPRKEGGCC